MENPFLGVVLHWLGGLASGSFYVPYRGVRKWSWETYWLVGGFFSWIIAPWCLAALLTHRQFQCMHRIVRADGAHPESIELGRHELRCRAHSQPAPRRPGHGRGAIPEAAPVPGHDIQERVGAAVGALTRETGEIAEKAKKIVRDSDSDFTTWDTEDLTKELGDTLWYVAVIADYSHTPLAEVAASNIAKLADRQKRGVLGGTGDNR